jgi:hypothetical protein
VTPSVVRVVNRSQGWYERGAGRAVSSGRRVTAGE